MHTTNADISIEELSKIEGAASCTIRVRDGKVTDCRFAITEMRRFFTSAVRGKSVEAVPAQVARICGTCSNAHMLAAMKAIENGMDHLPSSQTLLLRKLLNYGLIIRDHGLHLYVFVLPDIFNKNSILDFDENDPVQHQFLHDCFDVKDAGNKLGVAVGGRSVHAPFPRLGGFSKIPAKEQLDALVPVLNGARPKILNLIRLFAGSDFTLEQHTNFLALCDDEYSFLNGSLHSDDGRTFNPVDFLDKLERQEIPYSQASGYMLEGKPHMVGALARMNLNKDALHPATKRDAADALSKFPSKNIFRNNLAQAIEMLHAVDRSIELIGKYQALAEPESTAISEETTGIGVIEAPRGTLYHRYEIKADRTVRRAKIIVPTAQNQKPIETAIREWVGANLDKSEEEIRHMVEVIVRAYDPCMSCATHFLKLRIVKR